MFDARKFMCVASGASASDPATSFNQSIPDGAVQRSSILQQAADISEVEEPKLLLPRGAGHNFLKAWLQFTQLPDLADALRTSSTECIVSSLQAADFLADEDFINQSSPELMKRMVSPVDGDPTRKKRKTQKNKVPIGHSVVEERKEDNSKNTIMSVVCTQALQAEEASSHMHVMQIMRQLPPNICFKVLSSCPTEDEAEVHASLMMSMRYFHEAHHALILEALFHDQVSQGRLVLQSLESADFYEEVLKCLTATAALTQLTSLSFENLHVADTSLPDMEDALLNALVSLPLQQLHVESCILNTETCTTLSAAFVHTRVTALHSVAIVASRAEMQPEESTALLQDLAKLPALQCLKLTKVKQDCDDLVAICADMKKLTGLTQLHLEHCFNYRRSRMHVTNILAGMLQQLTGLKHLNLEGSLPQDDGAPCDFIEPILDSIACLTSLTFLNLSELGFREYNEWMLHYSNMAEDVPGDIQFGQRLAPMLHRLKYLQHLDLSDYAIASDVAESISAAICGLVHLNALFLSNVTEDENFWFIFATDVTSLRNLQDLCVSHNDGISNLNIGELARGLSTLPKLEWLRLCQTEIEREGVIDFAKHLPGMTALKDLLLKNNRISPRGARALAASLKLMAPLNSISLCKGDIGSEGEEAIQEALKAVNGHEWDEVLLLEHDYDEWDSDTNQGEENDFDGMDIEEIAGLLAAADEADNNAA